MVRNGSLNGELSQINCLRLAVNLDIKFPTLEQHLSHCHPIRGWLGLYFITVGITVVVVVVLYFLYSFSPLTYDISFIPSSQKPSKISPQLFWLYVFIYNSLRSNDTNFLLPCSQHDTQFQAVVRLGMDRALWFSSISLNVTLCSSRVW